MKQRVANFVWPLILTIALTGCVKKDASTETTQTTTETEAAATDSNAPVSTMSISDEAKKAAEPYLAKGSPSALFFYADWCPACRAFKPTLEEVEAKFPSVKVVRLNVDEQKDLTKAFKVSSIPSLFLFDKDGKFVESTTGGLTADKLKEEFVKIGGTEGAAAPKAAETATTAPAATDAAKTTEASATAPTVTKVEKKTETTTKKQ